MCRSLYLSNMSRNLRTVIKLNYLNYAPGGEQNAYVISRKNYYKIIINDVHHIDIANCSKTVKLIEFFVRNVVAQRALEIATQKKNNHYKK